MPKWPFWRTSKHKCPDGTTVIIHRNVDDAFPLYIPGWKGNLDANAQTHGNLASAGLKAEYASMVQGLLFGLNELNQSLMLMFRGAYVAFLTPAGTPACLQDR